MGKNYGMGAPLSVVEWNESMRILLPRAAHLAFERDGKLHVSLGVNRDMMEEYAIQQQAGSLGIVVDSPTGMKICLPGPMVMYTHLILIFYMKAEI